MNIGKLAIRNIIHRPLNLVLSVILFSLGVGLINFLLLFNTQLKEKFEKNLAGIDLVVGAKGSPLQMILCNMYHIDNPTGNISIKEATPFLREKHPLLKSSIPLSLGDSYRSYRIVGTNHEILNLYDGNLSDGKLYEQDMDVTIGISVAKTTGLDIGHEFHSAHGFEDDSNLIHDQFVFRVVGILEKTGSVLDNLILTNHSSVWKSHDHSSSDTVASYVNVNTNQALLEHTDKDITSILLKYVSKSNFQALNLARSINENTDMQSASPAIEMNRLYSMMGAGTKTLQWLGILIAFVSAISIFITLFKSLKERKYELALMRVMGGSKLQLLQLILIEGIILSILGFIIGWLLSHVALQSISPLLASEYRYSFTGWKFIASEWYLFFAAIGLGVLSALIPAFQASRTDINNILQN